MNGGRSDLGIHLVHKDAGGHLAVIAILFTKGPGNAAIQNLVDHLPRAKQQEIVADTTINATDLLPTERDYFSFSGSLTTPPCTEGVQWFVLQTPSTVSSASLEKLRHYIQTTPARSSRSMDESCESANESS